MQSEDLFKTALVVPDIDRARDELGATLGLEWTPAQWADLELRIGDRVEAVHLGFAYSCSGPPYLELLQAQPTGYYAIPDGPALHHVGWWVDDLAAASKELAARGMPLEAAGQRDGVAPVMFAFHTNPHGLRIELVDRANQPTFLEWVAGGELQI